MLAEACGVTNGALLYYFGSKDNIIIEATAHCMAKVEDDFMARAPKDFYGHRAVLAGDAVYHRKTPRREIPFYVSGVCKSTISGARQKNFLRV